MKKNRIYIMMAVLLLSFMVAGCSDETESVSEEEDDEISLAYWTMWGKSSDTGKALKAAADAYEDETGIKIEIDYKGEEFVRDGYMPAIDKGTVIDLVDYDLVYMNNNWEEYLLELDDYVDESDYAAGARESLLALAGNAGGGVIRTIPYRPVVYGFYYNKTLFSEAGIRSAPQTWEEFTAACIKLTEAGITPLTTDDEYAMLLFGNHLARYVGEEQVRDIVEAEDWDNDALIQTLEDYQELAENHAFSSFIEDNIAPSGQIAELAGGEVAMYFGYSTMPEELSDTAGDEFEWGSFAYPELPGGVNGTETNQYISKGIGISKGSEYPQEAFDFIQFLTQGEQDAAFSERAGIIPADPVNTEWPETLEHSRDLFEQTENRFSWAAGIESNGEVTDALRENFLKVCAGRMTAEEFVEAMKAQ